MQDNYTYLFPFEKIAYNSKILIYGAGDVGQEYLQQLRITKYAKVIGFIDRDYASIPMMSIPIYAPEKILELEADYIVLAMKTENYIQEITAQLLKKGFTTDNIVYVGSRNTNIELFAEHKQEDVMKSGLAYNKVQVSIALKYGPGLGDCIIKKRLFEEIVKLIPDCLIDIYAPNGEQYIPFIYTDQSNLNMVVSNNGISYMQNKNKYSVALSVFYMIKVDYIDMVSLPEVNNSFWKKIMVLKKHCEDYRLSIYPVTQNRIHFGRAILKGNNCYSIYNYTGIIHISDQKVSIPLSKSFLDIFLNLNLKQYITFNYGNGTTGKENKRLNSKQWPKAYFEEFVRSFKQQYPRIEVIQIGDNETEQINGADRYFLGRSLELVKYILKNAILHFDTEGGVMHLATQLGTKCVVLYGPTPIELFGYKQNINIVSSKCKDCYCLYDNMFGCARKLNYPECMFSIKPKTVMDRINVYMKMIL